MDEQFYSSCPPEFFESAWKEYDWEKAREELFSMQQSLTKAAYKKDESAIKMLQQKIVSSLEARMLAVKTVSETANVAGIDGKRWVSAEEKGRAAFRLNAPCYRAKPYRHVVVETKRGRERPINIPTFYDRAMQKLYFYALNPVAEAWGERKSFGFRTGRSPYDANEYIKEALSGKDAPNFVLLTDVESCYASISHGWLLKHLPMDKAVLKEFLKAGYVFQGELYPSEEYGISIGSTLSPVIANMTLDGMQKIIYRALYPQGEIDFSNGNLIRFADDLCIALKREEDAETVLQALSSFLLERGLKLSAKKTRIVRAEDGFDFLSWHFQKKREIVVVTPSERAVGRFMEEMEEFIFSYKGSQKSFIETIDRKILGFATYHRISDADLVFRKIDVFLKATLLKFCELSHPTYRIEKILKNFWFLDYNGQYVYALKERPEIRVQSMSDTLLIKHRKVKTNVNPYLDRDYLLKREKTREIQNATGRYRSIWKRQKGKCFYCGKPILSDQRKTLVPMSASLPDQIYNLAYIHVQCSYAPLEFFSKETLPQTENELLELINGLKRERIERSSRYGRLFEYFKGHTEPYLTLSFQEIEKINAAKLCKTAYEKNSFWFTTSETKGRISRAWIVNGYSLQRVDLKKQTIVLHRNVNEYAVKIPERILFGKVPKDAKFEIENFCDYIKEKYAL